MRLMCHDKTQKIQRLNDADCKFIHFTGGFQAAEVAKDAWQIQPVLDGDAPCSKGFFTLAELQAFTARNKFRPIAFHYLSWTNGAYHSSWQPIISNRTSHMMGPADLWRQVSSNLSRDRTGAKLKELSKPDRKFVADLLDDKSPTESLAQSISLSLRSMDAHVEQIAEFYHEQLVNMLAQGTYKGNRVGSSRDQGLYAHVLSFFTHLGAARDYFAALVAQRVGLSSKIDAMKYLVGAVKADMIGTDALLDLLSSSGFIAPSSDRLGEWKVAGWMKEISELRNQVVHKRPYGQKHVEKMGCTQSVDIENGLYRYFRQIVVGDDSSNDVLDLVVRHYAMAVAFFMQAAEVSGYDTNMLTLTDADVIEPPKITPRS